MAKSNKGSKGDPIYVEIHSSGQSAYEQDVNDALDYLGVNKATNSDVSQIRLAQIKRVNLQNNTLEIHSIADKQDFTVDYPGHMVDWAAGTGIWHGLAPGDMVLCSIGYGNKFIVLNKINNSISDFQLNGISDSSTDLLLFNSTYDAQNVDFKSMLPGDFLIKSPNNVKLKLSKNGITLGNSGKSSLTFDVTDINASQNGTSVLEANQKYEFDNSGYSIEGIVLRDRRIKNINGDDDPVINPRILFQWYKELQPVSFDPSLQPFEKTNDLFPRNPAFVEKRQVVYEFSDYNYDDPIESDQKESKKQSVDLKQQRDPSISRRARKSDSFSLSLISPNYLIEEIKGTAVDALGNIIDLNRTVLPIGENDGIVKLEGSEKSYYNVRELHRKSIAFHWELNARKDIDNTLSAEAKSKNEYGTTDDVYKKNRSRFFLDIDKEGQIKLNVPASSEKGNISVLTRYENYTNINPNEKYGQLDYDYFNRTDKTNVDILLDSVGNYSVVELVGNDKLLPKDRITEETIKLGTMYHDISTTCVFPFRGEQDENQGYGILSGPDTIIDDYNNVSRYILKNTVPSTNQDPTKVSIITKTINIDTDSANAGGRSATINFEGMVNTSIGANTVDRQSLWLDTQGGIVARIGADKNGISLATQTDGDVYWQIGGQPLGLDPDKRFKSNNNINDGVLKTNRLEIRVMQGNGPGFSRILFDNRGVIVTTPESIDYRAEKDINFYAGSAIRLNAEVVSIFEKTPDKDSLRVSKQSRKFEEVFVDDSGVRKFARSLDKVSG
jgi:hypothetical protein